MRFDTLKETWMKILFIKLSVMEMPLEMTGQFECSSLKLESPS